MGITENYEYLDDQKYESYKLEVWNESISSVDFSFDNIDFRDMDISETLDDNDFISITDDYKFNTEKNIDRDSGNNIETLRELENDRPVLKIFMERYSKEWEKLGED